MNLNPTQAAMIAALLRPRLLLLGELFDAQVQALPPGDCAWCETADEIQSLKGALAIMEAIK